MTYVLIAVIYFKSGITAEFNSLDKCKAAGEELIKMDVVPDVVQYPFPPVKYRCMEK